MQRSSLSPTIFLLLLHLLPHTSACSAFDVSPSTAQQMVSGVADNRGMTKGEGQATGVLANRALGQQTHVGNTGMAIGVTLATAGGLVEDANELFCYDFNAECRWRNMEGFFVDELDWYEGSGFLDQGRLQVATGTHISPEGAYAIVATDQVQLPTSKAILVSDVIACQLGPGEIRFLFWTSPQVQMKVCVKRTSKLFGDYDYCSPPVEGPDPGPAHMSIPDQGRQPFQVYVIADSFIFQAANLQGGFAIIDNLEYYAEMCPPPTASASASAASPRRSHMGGPPLVFMPPGVSAPGAPPTESPKLIQLPEPSFGGMAGMSPSEPSEEMETGPGQRRMVLHSTITRRGPLPGATEQAEEEEEEIVGPPPVPPPSFPKTLHRLPERRRTSPSVAEVLEGGNTEADEKEAEDEEENNDFTPATVNKLRRIHEMTDDVEEAGDVMEIRELEVSPAKQRKEQADGVLNSVENGPLFRKGSAIRKDACEVLNCRFERGDCASLVRGTDWRVSDRAVGNPLTGIRGDASLLPYNKDGSFAYTRGPRSNARLQTPPFNLGEDAYFIFAYHKVDQHSVFRVYARPKGEPHEYALFEAPVLSRNSSRRWFKEGRLLPAGDYDFIAFEARALPANNYIGVDEILVLDKSRQLLCRDKR